MFCVWIAPGDAAHSGWLIPLWPRAGGRTPYGTIFQTWRIGSSSDIGNPLLKGHASRLAVGIPPLGPSATIGTDMRGITMKDERNKDES
jgi:hypothetical protein